MTNTVLQTQQAIRETAVTIASARAGELIPVFNALTREELITELTIKTIELEQTRLQAEESIRELSNSSSAISDIVTKERDSARKELLEKEALMRTLLNTFPYFVWIKDRKGRFLAVNETFASYFAGNNITEIIGKTDLEFADPATAEKHLRTDREVFETGKQVVVEESFETNGAERIFEIHKTPIHNSSGDISGLIGFARDITELKLNEKALKESEERFRSIFENNSAAIGVYEFDSTISMVNNAYCRISGYSREEVIGKSWKSQIPPEDLTRLLEYNKIRLANPDKAPSEYHFGFYHKSGEIRQVLASIATNMNLKKIIISFIDVTDRLRAEKQLQESQQIFETTFESSPIPMALSSITDGKYKNINKTFILESGFQREELIGKTSFDLGIFVDINEREYIAQKVREEGSVSSYECNIKIKSGEILPCLVSSVRLVIQSEVYLLSSIINIKKLRTALEQLQKYSEELKELNAHKDKFFSIIAHDLKSPFQGLLGYSAVLADEYSTMDDMERKEYITAIREISQESFKLLEDLLQWSRMQAGSMPFNPEVININQDFASTFTLLTDSANRKNITFQKELEKNAFVHADKNMLTTIIRNLCSNAIKFTETGGSVTIKGYQDNNRYILQVVDTGIGMDEALLSNLFKIDKNVTRNGTAGEHSSGLGLLLCKEMVELHGDTLQVHSSVGKGSTMSFSVPVFRY